MKSPDRANWQLVSYAYDILDDVDELNLTTARTRMGGDPGPPAVFAITTECSTPRRFPARLAPRTGSVDADFVSARHTLTQRTFGPECSGMTAVDVTNLKDGDFAGLGLLQKQYGLVGVKSDGGVHSVVIVIAESGSPVEEERVPLNRKTVFLKAGCDFNERKDTARFFYSRCFRNRLLASQR